MIPHDPKRVLIVDDSIFQRKLIRLALEKEGFRILDEAETGSDAIQKFKQFQPHLVIMDTFLPELDGISVLREMKKINVNADVIMMSSYSIKEKLMQASELGAKKYLIKPFKTEKLMEAINEVLEV